MKRQDILEEIQEIKVGNFQDGLTLGEQFESECRMSQVELLLLFCKCSKYYYSYTEKKLRKLVLEDETLSKMNTSNISDTACMSCYGLNDDSVVKIKALEFTRKKIFYEDGHKVVTYDDDKQEYECFFVNLSEKKIYQFMEETGNMLDEEVTEFKKELIKRRNETASFKGHTIKASEEVDDAFETICDFMMKNSEYISEIKLSNVGGGIKIDVTSSKFYRY